MAALALVIADMVAPLSQDPGSLIDRAEQAYSQQAYDEALSLFQQALAASPANADLDAAVARCQRQLGNIDAAQSMLESILERQPSHYSALVCMAELQSLRGRPAAATGWFRQALQLQPTNGGLLAALCRSHMAAGECEEADHLLQQALEHDPRHAGFLLARLECNLQLGNVDQALLLSEALLAVEPATPWHKLHHVGLLRQLGRPHEALTALDAFDPGDDSILQAHGHQARAVILREIGQFSAALTALREAVRLDPTCPDHVVALASLLAELGAFEEGLDLLQEAEQRIGAKTGLIAQPWIQFSKVMLYRGAGDTEAALAIADGLSSDPLVGFSARVQRAELLIQRGDALTRSARSASPAAKP